MSITVNLEGTLEQQIRDAANQRGLPLEKQVAEILERFFRTASARPKGLPHQEVELLQKINSAIPVETWDAFYFFAEKKEKGTITEAEIEAFISITDQIENANVERIKYLIELAEFRKVSLPEVMLQLGLKHSAHA